MASSMIHLAITHLLDETISFSDPTRLYLGCVLADAGVSGNTHLKKEIAENTYTYDLLYYRKRFERNMECDDLYKGYYLHLIQDMIFRKFLYEEHHFSSLIPGNVEALHHDYSILNPFIIQKYHLNSAMVQNISLEKEPIKELGNFDTVSFLKDLKAQFEPVTESSLSVFTKEMTTELTARSFSACLEELQHLNDSASHFDTIYWTISQ